MDDPVHLSLALIEGDQVAEHGLAQIELVDADQQFAGVLGLQLDRLLEDDRLHLCDLLSAGARELQADVAAVAVLQRDVVGDEGIADDVALPGVTLEDDRGVDQVAPCIQRSEEHTSELQSLMRLSYAAFCLKQKIK